MNEAQLPPGHELLPEPFLREHGAQKGMQVLWKKDFTNLGWHLWNVGDGQGNMENPDEVSIEVGWFCAPTGTIAAATTPLPEGKCDCGGNTHIWAEEMKLLGRDPHHLSCSIHRRYRHILPHELAALPEKPEGLVWAEAGKPEDWDVANEEDWQWLKEPDADYLGDFAYAVPEPSVPAQGEEGLARLWNTDAPEGKTWKCPDCGSQATLGGNAAYHVNKFKHSMPTLVDFQPLPPAATSPVAPSGGEEESNPKLAELILYICEQSKDDPNFNEEKLKELLWRCDLEAFFRTGKTITGERYFKEPDAAPPAPTPAEAPTTKEDAVARIQYAIGSWLVIKNGESLGKAIREALDDFARTLERELSAMRQERDEVKRMLRCAIQEKDTLRAELATVTAERDEAKEEAAELLDARNDLARYIGLTGKLDHVSIGLKFDELKTERDAALASDESARKDGERLDWLEKCADQTFLEWQNGQPKTVTQFVARHYLTIEDATEDPGYESLRACIDAARLTSEGGR